MNTIKININKIKKSEISFIAEQFKQGKVVAYPTDTIYGLGCLATDVKAIKKIFKIKRIKKPRPLIILISGYKMLKEYAQVDTKQIGYLKKIWPGAVTVILNDMNKLPKELLGSDDSIGVRLPKNNFLIKIIKKAGKPIVSTSLNISGKDNITPDIKLKKYFGIKCPDLVVETNKKNNKKSSKIIDLRDYKEIKIIRN